MTPVLRGENIPRAAGTHKRGPGRWRCLLPGCGMTGTGDYQALRRHLNGSHYRPDEHGIWRTR